MKKIKKRKGYRIKRPVLMVSGVICAVCLALFARKMIGNAVEQKKEVKAAYYDVYTEDEEDERPLVCIDAGHGGSDCGADYAGAYEKDETLMIARLVKRHLESAGVKVLMTRDADTYLGLDERVEICNNASCDVLVSIHRNLYEDDPSINGVETWIHHELPEDDVFLAEAITTRLDAIAGIKSRGVKGGSMTDSEEDYRLNRNTNCTSCLVELGFMSNANDNRLITDKREETASAISDGIMEYLNSRQ